MLSVQRGHSVRYLTDEVAKARESYYTGAVAAGEPPGLWWGAGAETLGLPGEVDADLMEAIYTHLLDPRDPAAHDRAQWDDAAPLAAGHRKYRSAEEVYAGLLDTHPDAGPEERAAAARPGRAVGPAGRGVHRRHVLRRRSRSPSPVWRSSAPPRTPAPPATTKPPPRGTRTPRPSRTP